MLRTEFDPEYKRWKIIDEEGTPWIWLKTESEAIRESKTLRIEKGHIKSFDGTHGIITLLDEWKEIPFTVYTFEGYRAGDLVTFSITSQSQVIRIRVDDRPGTAYNRFWCPECRVEYKYVQVNEKIDEDDWGEYKEWFCRRCGTKLKML